jgi:DNA-binding NarL/FixJ family response regulator
MKSDLLPSPANVREPRSGESGPGPVRRVVIIDPRPERRTLTSWLVSQRAALTVVGEAGSLGEAEAQIRDEHADVALVEIQMPVAQGLATIGTLRAQFADLQIVVCSFHRDSASSDAARRLGADGYLTKPLRVDDLLELLTSSGVKTAAL